MGIGHIMIINMGKEVLKYVVEKGQGTGQIYPFKKNFRLMLAPILEFFPCICFYSKPNIFVLPLS